MKTKIPFFRNPSTARYLRTTLILAIAALMLWLLWQNYMLSPWTRDGRVNAEIVNIAPEIEDQIVEIRVHDNQWVNKGDVLAIIDPARYQFALNEAVAKVEDTREVMIEKQQEAARRVELLDTKVVSKEEKELSGMTAETAKAQYDEAVSARDLAQLNLQRTVIRATVNGWITNFHLRVGDYATPGKPILSILDADSFWVAAYMEETKLPRVQEGDKAHIQLMGVRKEIIGHVETVSAGIQDQNEANFTGFANVNPIFNWVRLAQRIPVRIHIDQVPKGVRVVAGQTCTVVIDPRSNSRNGG